MFSPPTDGFSRHLSGQKVYLISSQQKRLTNTNPEMQIAIKIIYYTNKRTNRQEFLDVVLGSN